MVADVGLYRKLKVGDNGEPSCEKIEEDKKEEDSNKRHRGKVYAQFCTKENYASQGNVSLQFGL